MKKRTGSFQSNGTLYWNVGSYEQYGYTRETSAVDIGDSVIFSDHDLNVYDKESEGKGYPKELYARFVVSGGGCYSWVGPIKVSKVTDTGSIQVNIEPSEAVQAGAKWNALVSTLTGWEYGYRSDQIVSGIELGTIPISFKDISGWTKPSDTTVNVTANGTAKITRSYTPISAIGLFQDGISITGPISFEEQYVGSRSGYKSVFLKNTGNSEVKVAVSLENGDNKDFNLTSNSETTHTLVAGNAVELRVRFAPNSSGDKSTTLKAAVQGSSVTAEVILNGKAISNNQGQIKVDWREPLQPEEQLYGYTVYADGTATYDGGIKEIWASFSDSEGRLLSDPVRGAYRANSVVQEPFGSAFNPSKYGVQDGSLISVSLDIVDGYGSKLEKIAETSFKWCLSNPCKATSELKVEVAGTGSGQVGGAGNYAVSSTVNLTATHDDNSTFKGWLTLPCADSFTMPAYSLTCTATFELKPPRLTLEKPLNGTIISTVDANPSLECTTTSTDEECQKEYDKGTPVTLEANPIDDYQFVSWTGCSIETSPKIFVQLDQDKTCGASFIKTYPLKIVVDGAETTTQNYAVGEQINLVDPQKDDYRFTGWVEPECESLTVMPNNKVTCTAIFEKLDPPLEVTPNEDNGSYVCIKGTGRGKNFLWSLSLNGSPVEGTTGGISSMTPGSQDNPAPPRKIARSLADEMTSKSGVEFMDDGRGCIDLGHYTLL